MEGAYMHWHAGRDIPRLREFLYDLRHGNPYRALRWRAKEEELTDKLQNAEPYGCPFNGVRIWLPQNWLDIIFSRY